MKESKSNHENFLFRPTLVGEELYTQMGYFLFKQFSLIDIIIVESCEWYH